MPKRNQAEALRDYMEAYKAYNDKLDEYFPVRQVVSGQPIKAGKLLTQEVLLELDKLGIELEEKRKAWVNSI